MKCIRDKGIRLTELKRRRIAVIGYGSQGRAQVLNLRDSGCDVVVGLRPGSPSFKRARRDRVGAKSIHNALMGANLVVFLLPDEHQLAVYQKYVAPVLQKGMGLVFAHGLNITFKKILPPQGIDVLMVSPKGPGPTLRKAYQEGDALPSLIAVHQNATGKAKQLAIAFAKAIGCSKRGMFETTFRVETIADLFGEQTVLCGGVVELMRAAFEILVASGIPAEAAYFECFHELKFIVDLLHQKGIAGMVDSVSPTAHYGGATRGRRLINGSVRKELRKILGEIKSGAFVEEWFSENKNGRKKHKRLSAIQKSSLVEKKGRKIRKQIGY